MGLSNQEGIFSSRSLRSAQWIFVLAFFAGVYQMLFSTGFGFGTGWEAVAIARELCRSGTFGNPFEAGPSGPTAFIPPLFPLYLAGLMKLLGDSPAFAITASLLAVVTLATHAALLPRLSLQLFNDARPGVFAGLFAAVSMQFMPQWDVAYTCCGSVLFLMKASLLTRRSAAVTGVCAGLLLLTNPATLLILGPWLWHLYRKQIPGGLRAAAVPVGVLMVAMLIVTLPWMLRNQVVLGTLAIKNNLGYTIYASNSDCALATLNDGPASECMSSRNPNKNPAELARLTQQGETLYDANRKADAIHWIRTHRDAFLTLLRARIIGYWFPSPQSAIPVRLATLLSLPAFYLWLRRRLTVGYFLIAIAALYPLVYYLVLLDIRYRYPVLWISLLGAGYTLTEALTAISRKAAQTNTTYPAPPSPQTDAPPVHT